MTSDFQNPELHLAQADPRSMAALVATTADLSLVVDGDDIIKDVSHNFDPPLAEAIRLWSGRPIEHVVRVASRPALKKALHVARDGLRGERFDVSHLIEGGRDLPVQYAALGIGADGIMLVGRDLRIVADLQTRLMENRQSMDRNARRQKQAEAHYRLLFETASEAIAIVDAETGKIREANPRAAALLGSAPGPSGKKFSALFDRSAATDIQSMLAAVFASGHPATLSVGGPGGNPLTLAAEPFRAGDLKLIIIRLFPQQPSATSESMSGGIESLVRNAAEAVVLTDGACKIVWANESFVAFVDLPLVVHAIGKPLGDFFQWSGAQQDILLKNVRQHGRIPPFVSLLNGANGQATEVELSAIAVPDGAMPGYGFVMRALPAEGARHGHGNSDLARAAENLVDMIGRVPMKDLVRDTTDVIERMCIEAALKLTGNNRASAARVLGLSRQALYLKLNRFGIADAE